jgi:hypothetical protein
LSSIFWTPWPDAGDIVDCKFPEGRFPEGFETPGPKERPVLVLVVEESTDDSSGCVVVVAYATSKNTTKVYPGEFVISADSISGLTKDTKFDLVNRHRLPFNDRWFKPSTGSNPTHPKRGKLDLNKIEIKKKLIAAITVAEALRKAARQKD